MKKSRLIPILILLVVYSSVTTCAQPANTIGSYHVGWKKNIGCLANDAITDIIGNNEQGYVFVGYTYSECPLIANNIHGRYDAWIMRIDPLGNKVWSAVLGGGKEDIFYSVKKLSGEGYITVGSTVSDDGDIKKNQGKYDGLVAKYNESGQLIWAKTLGGSGYDLLYDVAETKDLGYLAVGGTLSTDGDINTTVKGKGDAWVVRLDSSGKLLWQKTLGNSDTVDADNFLSIARTSDSNYVMCGKGTAGGPDIPKNQGLADVWVLKMKDDGTVLWSKAYGGTGGEIGNAIAATNDGGSVITAYSTSSDGDLDTNKGNKDIWVFKLNAQGKLLWQKSYGGSNDETGSDIVPTLDGGYMVVGYSFSKDGDIAGHYGPLTLTDMVALKLDSIGGLETSDHYGGSAGEGYPSVLQDKDSSFLLAGITQSNSSFDVGSSNGPGDVWLARLVFWTTGVRDVVQMADNISVYPTIANNYVYIELPESNTEAEIGIHDITGRKAVCSIVRNGRSCTLNVTDLAPGMYILNVAVRGRINNYKFIRE